MQIESYKTYICSVCGAESKSLNKIKLCHAQHVGLSTLEDYAEWLRLEENAAACTRRLFSTNNNHLRTEESEAYAELLAFEKQHNVHKPQQNNEGE